MPDEPKDGKMATMTRLGRLAVAAVAVLTLLGSVPVGAAPSDPPAEFSLADMGISDQVLRGGTTTLDVYLPGPGRYRMSEDGEFTLIFSYAEIADPGVSTVSVLFNAVPIRTWVLTPETSAMHAVELRIPMDLIRNDINLVQVRFIMRLRGEACGDVDHPSLTATVYRQSRLRYRYEQGFPRVPPPLPDLGSFPLTLLEPSPVQENRLAIVVPDDPSATDLRAAANLAGAVGRFSGGRPVVMRLIRASQAGEELRQGHVAVIGRPGANTLWQGIAGAPQGLPVRLLDAAAGTFQGFDAAPVRSDDGVLMDLPSPWAGDFRAVLVTGTTDEAVLRASLALSSETARRTLHGDSAVVTERAREPLRETRAAARASLTDFTLGDLGFADRTVNGWGTHRVNMAFDAIEVPARGARATVVYDHSRVVNGGISALGVLLNDTPLYDTALATDRSERSSLEVALPTKVLRTGRNVLTVQFYLSPQPGTGGIRLDEGTNQRFLVCGNMPPELAWGVLYADTTIHLPPGTAGGVGLGSFPFPFVREGRFDDTILVIPDDVREAENLPSLAAELGRVVSADVLDVPVVSASRLTLAQRQEANLIVFGLPRANPLMEELGPWLPLWLDARGRVVQSVGDALTGVQDGAVLGILETATSPFHPERSILVLTGTAPGGLELALRGLSQGRLAGNLATVQSPEAGSRTYRVRTFDVPLIRLQTPPAIRVQEAAPWAAAAAGAAATAALATVSGLALLRAARRRAARTVGETGEGWEEGDDWLDDLESADPASRQGARERQP